MDLDQYPQITLLAESLQEFGNSAERNPEWRLTELWRKLYGGVFFDSAIFLKGWKSDYIRASRLFFITTAITGSTPQLDYIPDKSTDLPSDALAQIRKWIEGWEHTVLVYGFDANEEKKQKRQQVRIQEVFRFLSDNHDQIWQLTDILRVNHDRKYYRRERLAV